MIHEYPFTNFNEYNLDWVIAKIKDLAVEWAEQKEIWSNMETEWEDMKNYINNYFENLDIQQEVNEKIDEMVQDGTMSALIYPYVQAVIPDVQEIVEAWLDDNVDPDSGYVIDKSLTIDDAAADAAVTGETIRQIRKPTENIFTNFSKTITVPSDPGFIATMLKDPLPAGSYTFVCKYHTDHTNKIGRLRFSSSLVPGTIPAETVTGAVNLPAYDSAADGVIFQNITTTATSYQIQLFSATTAGASNGYGAVFTDIMILSGSGERKNYMGPYSAIDQKFNGIFIESPGDTTNMTNTIQRALQTYGYVVLGKGTFYVKDLLMPSNTRLSGSGYDTKVQLIASGDSNDHHALYLGSHSIVENMAIIGNTVADITVEDHEIGVLWSATSRSKGIISNCYIESFSKAGIVLYSTGFNTDNNVFISDCYISGCYAGILVPSNSEYNKIVNCTIGRNYIGFLNRGGNNIIANCGLDDNMIGIYVNADQGSNNGHGNISNCTINHAGNNTGYGLIIKDTGRMLVDNCNFYYSNILLDTTNGNIINGCGFGTDAKIEIDSGECNIISNCMFHQDTIGKITITNNTLTKISNCYDRYGTSVTA